MKTPQQIRNEVEKEEDKWGKCIYCGKSMSKAFHRPMICGSKECVAKSDETIKKMYESGELK